MGHGNNISHQERGFYYSDAQENDNLDGRSLEHPKKTIQAALDATQNLVPPPSVNAVSFVREAQGGLYVENITLYESALFEGTQTTIVSTGLVGITAASFVSFRPQTVVNNTDNATVIKCENIESFGSGISAMFVGGDNGIGVSVSGTYNDLFLSCNQVKLRGENSVCADIKGTGINPIDFNFQTVLYENDGCEFFNFDPDLITDTADVEISSLFDSGAGHANTKGVTCKQGVLKVRAGSLQATTVIDVQGGQLALDALALIGNTTVSGGNGIFDTAGVILGNLNISNAGTLQVRSTNIVGDITTADTAGLSIKADQVIGDITIAAGTSAFLVIDSHIGALVDDGSINGRINGVPYGNWESLGYVLATWGADLQNTGRHPAINGLADGPEIPSLGISASAEVPAAGTIDTITYYNTTGDNTTEFQIIKNGVVMYTFTCVGPYGVETGINVPTGFVGNVADNIAIRYASGTAPGPGFYSMYIN